MAFVVAGFSKVYVGEIIEKGKKLKVFFFLCMQHNDIKNKKKIARDIMEEWGHDGSIRPEHLREAHRRYKKDQITTTSFGKRV